LYFCVVYAASCVLNQSVIIITYYSANFEYCIHSILQYHRRFDSLQATRCSGFMQPVIGFCCTVKRKKTTGGHNWNFVGSHRQCLGTHCQHYSDDIVMSPALLTTLLMALRLSSCRRLKMSIPTQLVYLYCWFYLGNIVTGIVPAMYAGQDTANHRDVVSYSLVTRPSAPTFLTPEFVDVLLPYTMAASPKLWNSLPASLRQMDSGYKQFKWWI